MVVSQLAPARLQLVDSICTADVKTLIALLGTAADPTVGTTVAARQRTLFNGLQQLIDADVWIWFTGEFHALIEASDWSSSLLYEGFQDEHDPIEVFQAICRPIVQAAFTPRISACRVDERHDVPNEKKEVNGAGRCSDRFRACDIVTGDHVTAVKCRQGDGTYSGVSFHRRHGRPAFTAIERALVETLVQNVAWLHSAPADAQKSDIFATLSPREREVMDLLLSGKSRKAVAQQLTLSTHTVADYLKQIYAKLDVNSRAELLAKFIPGNRES